MNSHLEQYQSFIDHLVKIRPCVLIKWVSKGWPRLDQNRRINKFLSGLSRDEKEILGQMLQQAKDEGIGDVLSYFDDEISLHALRVSRDGVELAIEPYGTELIFDWVARSAGDAWPEHQLKDSYRLEGEDELP